ncbi:hypothetical protein PR202_ga20951 [Eleusine coracana subsp. coracana]|uniref:Uncharacterized protein n=1 Tax=Eleusine coracana subsp. coracana TaxID=191504 RepID=A0AAV5CZJ0_ELECO|nr:hypothetical protein PR202_ga20951 [Eleusine coracana subsp. coracana]
MTKAKLRAEGKPNPLPNTNERTRNWLYGRSKLTDEGDIIVKDPVTVEVVQSLKGPIATQTEAGLFTLEYHKDELAKAIGTKEHGCRAAMDAFLRGSSSSTQPSVSMQPSVSTQPSVSGQPSISMQPSEMEDLTKEMSCELDVPFGYKGKTMKVASDMALPGRTLRNLDIPPGYMRVSVV